VANLGTCLAVYLEGFAGYSDNCKNHKGFKMIVIIGCWLLKINEIFSVTGTFVFLITVLCLKGFFFVWVVLSSLWNWASFVFNVVCKQSVGVQWIRVCIVSCFQRVLVLFLQYEQSSSCAVLLLLCLRNYSLGIEITVRYCHCFHLRDSLLGWIIRSIPLDWSALCSTNPSSIEMATIVDPKTWEKLGLHCVQPIHQ
jgi:hypothetical protein